MTKKQSVYFCNGVMWAIQQVYDKLHHEPTGLQEAGNEVIYNHGIRGWGIVFNSQLEKFHPIAGIDVNKKKPGIGQ